jgi:hypothetical protein
MNPPQRIDGFVGTDAEYIVFLEKRVGYVAHLEQRVVELERQAIHFLTVAPSRQQAPTVSQTVSYQQTSPQSQRTFDQPLTYVLQPSLSSLQQIPSLEPLSLSPPFGWPSTPGLLSSQEQGSRPQWQLSHRLPSLLQQTYSPIQPLRLPVQPPPSPPSSISSRERVQSERRAPDNGAEFVFYESEPKAKKPRLGDRISRELSHVFYEIPLENAIHLQRQSLDLLSWERILCAFDMIQRHANRNDYDPSGNRFTLSDANRDDGEPSGNSLALVRSLKAPTSSESNQLDSAKKYVEYTTQLDTDGVLMTIISRFRRLVFASWCIVMLHCRRYSTEVIDSLMENDQKSDQKSGQKNHPKDVSQKADYLRRLRGGALWVNQLIAELGQEFGHQASEFFFLCKFQASYTPGCS